MQKIGLDWGLEKFNVRELCEWSSEVMLRAHVDAWFDICARDQRVTYMSLARQRCRARSLKSVARGRTSSLATNFFFLAVKSRDAL